MAKLELKKLEGAVELKISKPWYKSKTMWVNILTVIAGAGSIVGNFSGMLEPTTYAIAISVVGVANILLRAVTDSGVSLKA